MNPLVSVIIPSFNHVQYIENAINSVLSQDYDNFELIVVDDGSKDNSHALLSSLNSDPRMRIILNDINKGQSAVLNQALKLAQGEFVCLLPSDDWYLPNKLTLQVEKFLDSDNDVGVIYARGLLYFSESNETRPVNLPMHRGCVLEKLIKEPNFVYPVTPMFRRTCFDFFPPDETYKAEGEAIYLKIALKYKFDYIEDIVAVMRDHIYNTGKITEMMYLDNIRYWSEFFIRNDIPEYIIKLKNIPIARIHRLKGLEFIMLERNFSAGRTALYKSIVLKPFNLFDWRVLAGLVISYLPHVIANFAINQKIRRTYKVSS